MKKPRPDCEARPQGEGTRRPYSTPKLTEYGPVSKLTRSGKGSVLEGTSPNRMSSCL